MFVGVVNFGQALTLRFVSVKIFWSKSNQTWIILIRSSELASLQPLLKLLIYIFRFIHDTALRRTMLKAHLQAWVWQDEWFGLTMEVSATYPF